MKLRKMPIGQMFFRNPLLKDVCFLTLVIAATISLINGLATGIFVSSAIICCLLMRWGIAKFVTEEYRMAVYLVGVCAIISLGGLAAEALYPDFASRMALYLPLAALYCLTERTFDYGTKSLRSVLYSTVSNCVGFTLCCAGIGLVREFFAFGTVLGYHAIKNYNKMPTMVLPVGGMIVFAVLLALINYISRKGDKS